MSSDQPPAWALRLRAERSKRLWSQKTMAISLRNAADEETRDYLPSLESLKRYVRDYEAGKHRPGDLYAELYCRAFGLSYETLFGEAPPARAIATTNTSDEALAHIAQSAALLAELIPGVHRGRSSMMFFSFTDKLRNYFATGSSVFTKHESYSVSTLICWRMPVYC